MTEAQPLSHEDYLKVTSDGSIWTGTLGDIDIKFSLPLDHNSVFGAPQHDMGSFDTLPLELQQIVLASVDLQTLTDFRRVNRRARQVTESVPDYANILKFGLNFLRAALGIETAKYITCTDLWRTLTSGECAECGMFGTYLYLPTCKRLCLYCFCVNPKYRPMTVEEASRRFVTDKAAIRGLPSMRSLPGRYTRGGKRHRSRIELITDVEAAKQIGLSTHGDEERMKWAAEKAEFRKAEKYERRQERARDEGSQKRVRRPARVFPKDKKWRDPFRFMAITIAPVIHKTGTNTAVEEWGRHCLAVA